MLRRYYYTIQTFQITLSFGVTVFYTYTFTFLFQMYVQELAEMEGLEIYDLLINRGAHFYVCGDCKMAEDVHQKLKGIVKKHGNMTDDEVQNFMFMLKVYYLDF